MYCIRVFILRTLESTEAQTAQERQLAELQQGLAMYQRLGLFFEHTGGATVAAKNAVAGQSTELTRDWLLLYFCFLLIPVL